MTSYDSPWTCVVCGETEPASTLYEVCVGCGQPYHYNQTNSPAKDCGAAWVEDEEVGMVFYCNTCMETARTEDRQKIEDIAKAAAAGAVTPQMLTDLMEAITNSGAAPAASPFAGFPGMPGVPGAADFSGPIAGADLGRALGATAPAPPKGEAHATPPRLAGRRSKSERRFRRIQ